MTQLSTSAVHSSFGEWAFEAVQNGLHPMIYVSELAERAPSLDSSTPSRGNPVCEPPSVPIPVWRSKANASSAIFIPWSKYSNASTPGELDLAIIEMDWSDLHTIAWSETSAGAVIVSTICPHKEYCLLEDTKRAIAGLKALLLSTPESTMIAADIDDSAYPSLNDANFQSMILPRRAKNIRRCDASSARVASLPGPATMIWSSARGSGLVRMPIARSRSRSTARCSSRCEM